MYQIEWRKPTMRNADPQGRVYHGCVHSPVWTWTEWEHLCNYATLADAEDSVATFSRINPAHQYRIVP